MAQDIGFNPSNSITDGKNLWERITTYGRMIKFSHTIFALPFALSAMILANRYHPIGIYALFWMLAAMVGARSAAMGFNRIADARIDAENPRTAIREIPSGKLSLGAAKGFVAIFSGLFIFAAAMLGPLCFYLSIPVLLVLFFYSYTKRFTWLAHLYLGFAISLAPIGAWIAGAGGFSPAILLLSGALMTYIAGFDILYACQDADFDREAGLFSIPSRFGIKRALVIAKGLHLLSFGFFMGVYFAFEMTPVYPGFIGLIGIGYIIEHRLIRPDDLRRIDIAFFHVNSVISVLVFFGILADEITRRLL